MLKKEILTKEVGELEMLISAVASDIAEQQLSNDRSESANDLLKEMQEALEELRLARGVRLMLLNAFGARTSPRVSGNEYNHATRRANRPLRRAS